MRNHLGDATKRKCRKIMIYGISRGRRAEAPRQKLFAAAFNLRARKRSFIEVLTADRLQMRPAADLWKMVSAVGAG